MIPFFDLKLQYETVKEEIEAAVRSTLASSQYVLGEEVAAFEEEFAAYSGARLGVGVNSGTSALHTALLAVGRVPGILSYLRSPSGGSCGPTCHAAESYSVNYPR